MGQKLLTLAMRILFLLQQGTGLLDGLSDGRQEIGNLLFLRLAGPGQFPVQAEQLFAGGEDCVDDRCHGERPLTCVYGFVPVAGCENGTAHSR